MIATRVDATLATNDVEDFRHMPGLRLVDWLRAKFQSHFTKAVASSS